MEAAGLDWEKTLECVNSEWATETMLNYEKLTNPVIQERTNWVPTILYNGVGFESTMIINF